MNITYEGASRVRIAKWGTDSLTSLSLIPHFGGTKIPINWYVTVQGADGRSLKSQHRNEIADEIIVLAPSEHKDSRLILPLANSTESNSAVHLARMWLEQTVSSRHERRNRPSRNLPGRLIDVTYQRTKVKLVPRKEVTGDKYPKEVAYATLAHFWGPADFLTLTTYNFQLQELLPRHQSQLVDRIIPRCYICHSPTRVSVPVDRLSLHYPGLRRRCYEGVVKNGGCLSLCRAHHCGCFSLAVFGRLVRGSKSAGFEPMPTGA
ncbi:hypothetical protein ABVK25_001139 [Lepraria finkii]|uniref:Uncharacterized protein n=1 Tax=Lepraria finkii TaxID=1340010 RepID=A0ABR4BNK4_9LECA